MQKYRCSNIANSSSGQRYPIRIDAVKWMDIGAKKYPGGVITVSFEDVDGHCCTGFLTAHESRDGRHYCLWGGHRLYEGYHGPVALQDVPNGVAAVIRSCGGTTVQ